MAHIPMSKFDFKRQWFDQHYSNDLTSIYRPAQPGVLYTCPCCGYPTLQERCMYEICSICNWEDDGSDDPLPNDRPSGPNGGITLTQGRRNFRRYLCSSNPAFLDSRRAKYLEACLPTIRAMIEAFDAMPRADETKRKQLWVNIEQCRERLRAISREI